MLKFSFIYVLLTSVWIATRASLHPHNLPALSVDTVTPNPVDCLTSNSLESAIYCRGSRAIRNVIHNLNRNDKPLVIVRGLEIVPILANEAVANAANSSTLDHQTDSDDSFLGHFSKYLRTHELNIKFSDLLAEESERYLARDAALQSGGANISDGIEEARKKDKGQGMLLAMAMMFGKMMAVMGLGGIGALAMKALGVAMAALLMASMIGLKSLSQQGHDSSHSVQYVTAEGGHHHKRRRRRSVMDESSRNKAATILTNGQNEVNPLALMYRGWQNNYDATKLI